MADIAITAANVVAAAGADIDRAGIAGATVTAGQVVYKDATTGKYLLADSNSVTVAARAPTGVALNGASNGQPLAVMRKGRVTIGGTLVAGVAYYLSDTPGGIAPVADVGAGEYSVLIGIATSTSVLDVNIQASGVAL